MRPSMRPSILLVQPGEWSSMRSSAWLVQPVTTTTNIRGKMLRNDISLPFCPPMEGRRGAGPQLQPDTASCAHIFRDQRTVITVTSLPWFVAAGSPGTLRLPPGVVILGYAEVRARSISGAAHAAQGGVIAQAATSGEAGQVPEAH